MAVSMGTGKDQKTLVRATHLVTPEGSARDFAIRSLGGVGRRATQGKAGRHLQSHPALWELMILM